MTAQLSTDFEVRPAAGQLGAEILGVDLSDPLAEATADSIKQQLHQHGVLFFPRQSADPLVHRSFAARFGQPVMPHPLLETLGEPYPEISVISTDNGGSYQADHWHSDVTWKAEPSRYSMLHMQELPSSGGDTMWSSQYLAYESLSDGMRAMLDPMTARHELLGHPDRYADHPVVIVHPQTGRRSLFVNSLFTVRINELTKAESDALIPCLMANATRPEFTCRRRWSVGDIAIWDNHFVQHYAIYDYGAAPRRIHRIELAAEAPSAAN